MRFPYVIYGDIQCRSEQIDTYQPDTLKAYTDGNQQNTPSGFTTVSSMLMGNTKKQKCSQWKTLSRDLWLVWKR